MFTGIVEGLGQVQKIYPKGGGLGLAIKPPFRLDGTQIGDSIAVNGACLTVTSLKGDLFEVDVSYETLRRTTLGKLKVGEAVNLERALRLGDRIGGHLVTGHVDGVGRILNREDRGAFIFLAVEAPEEVAHYLVEKGSVALDGISLTVNRVRGLVFELTIIPHTAEITTLKFRKPGDEVNLEADLLAKYVEKFLRPYQKEDLEAKLRDAGFYGS